MTDLHDFFVVELSEDKMEAVIKQIKAVEKSLELMELKQFLEECGVTYGIKEEILLQIIESRVEFPVQIAQGITPISGEDAYLKTLIHIENVKERNNEKSEPLKQIDYREVMEIPSVTNGTVVGVKVETTEAINGVNVLSQEVSAAQGRDMKLRQGKNTRVSQDGKELIALIDGQICIEPKVIHVFPTYEVAGDVDMRIGNIDFVGNINIRGGVPSGFRITAKGDIRIHGSVEAAELEAGGSIFIQQGVVAQGKGLIKAKGDFHTAFINQGNVDVEGDVHVQSILHSHINALGHVYCNKSRGNIVGGHVSSAKGIVVNEVGNTMSTPTSLYLGVNQNLIENQKQYNKELNFSELELEKLRLLLMKFIEKGNQSQLTPQERVLKLRIRKSIEELENRVMELQDKLFDINGLFDHQADIKIHVHKYIYPNTDIYFGKYRRRIISKHDYIAFRLDHSEIKMESL